MLKLKILVVTFLFTLCTPVYAMNDFWTGTVSIEQGGLILTRCGIGQHKFFLIDEKRENASLIAQLPPEVKSKSTKVSVTVVGDVTGETNNNGQYILVVNEFKDIKLSSCHLSDMLG